LVMTDPWLISVCTRPYQHPATTPPVRQS
jgi:hypothetical protein